MTNEESRAIFHKCHRFLNGDYPARPAEELARLAQTAKKAEVPDNYGEGLLIESFEKEVAALLGKDAAVFMPSGTMAQVIAIRIYCDKKQNKKIAFHATSHLEIHEKHSYRELHGLTAEFLGESQRVLNAEDFNKSKLDFAAAIIEIPHRELGGTLPEWTELQAISLLCKKNGISLHMDGARLWESAPYYKKTYEEISSLFDSVYVSFYKGLGGIAGAALAGSRELITEAKIWQRRHGGNLVHLYPYVISARDGLKRQLPKMAMYHAKALEIAVALSSFPEIKIRPAIPHTNMMELTFEKSQIRMEEAFLKMAVDKKIAMFRKLNPTDKPHTCKAELTVGHATVDMKTSEIVGFFKEALELAR